MGDGHFNEFCSRIDLSKDWSCQYLVDGRCGYKCPNKKNGVAEVGRIVDLTVSGQETRTEWLRRNGIVEAVVDKMDVQKGYSDDYSSRV